MNQYNHAEEVYIQRQLLAFFQLYKSNMYKNLFVACLLLAVASSSLFLTPATPPTAYQNQFYSARFRVRGLDDPVFTFEGLPKTLTGSADGLLSGIPATEGSFSIVIRYRSGSESGSKQVILKVQPDYRNTDSIVISTKTAIGLVIEYPGNLIFRVSQSFRVSLTVKNAVGPVVWVFRGLPTGLKGNSNDGSIQGEIAQSGYYNVEAECADKEGRSGQAYFVLNIQPKVTLTSKIFSQLSGTKVVEVESKTTVSSVHSHFDLIEAEQVAADNELFKALDNVDTRKKIVAEARNKVAAGTLRVTNAQNSFNAADAAWKQAVSDLELSKNLLSSAQSALNAAQQNLQLALTEQGQAAKTLAAARQAVDDAQARFNAASKAVSDAEDNLVKAKAAYSKADQALTDAKTQRAAAEQEYKRAYDALEAAKTQLEDAKARKTQADQAVKAAQDALEIATQARDDADSALKQADFNLSNAEKALDAALKKVAAIREKFNAAKDELSAAQWDWELVLNKLYVAQSRKETADRASAIALAEGSASDHNVNNGVSSVGGSINLANGGNVSFGGCDARNYPVISGNSKVVSVSSNGYSLASGHQVIYGSCSNAAKCSVGDFVNYNGYIVNGVVNALRIERVLLS